MSQDNRSAVFGGLQHTLLDAVTATGDGAEKDLRNVYYHHSLEVEWSGTVPDAVYITIKGCINDSSTYGNLVEQHKVTESPCCFEVRKGARYILGNYDSKDGGDETTAVTVRSVSGGQ